MIFLLACEADAKGRTGLEQASYPQAEMLKLANHAASSINTDSVLNGDLKGDKIGSAIHQLRIKSVTEAINNYKQL